MLKDSKFMKIKVAFMLCIPITLLLVLIFFVCGGREKMKPSIKIKNEDLRNWINHPETLGIKIVYSIEKKMLLDPGTSLIPSIRRNCWVGFLELTPDSCKNLRVSGKWDLANPEEYILSSEPEYRGTVSKSEEWYESEEFSKKYISKFAHGRIFVCFDKNTLFVLLRDNG